MTRFDPDVFCHQAHRLLLRPSAARLRRHLQAPARPQRHRRDRGPHRSRSTTATWSAISATSSAIVKGWIDRELDHKMVLRHDDPLVAPLQQLGEPVFLVDSNPTVERIARLIFDYAASRVCRSSASRSGKRRRRSRSTAVNRDRGVTIADRRLVDPVSASSSSISTARWSIRGATSPSRRTRCSTACGAAPLAGGGDRPHGRRRRGDAGARAPSPRPAVRSRPTRSSGSSRSTTRGCCSHTRPYRGHPRGARRARAARARSRC